MDSSVRCSDVHVGTAVAGGVLLEVRADGKTGRKEGKRAVREAAVGAGRRRGQRQGAWL